jgi:hypothetical protein
MSTAASRVERPETTEYAPYYERYVALAAQGDLLEMLRRQRDEMAALAHTFTEERAGTAYAEGKWSVKEVVGHMTDAERVFSYRAMRIARADRTPLPSMEQDGFVRAGNFNRRTLEDLLAEFASVRDATLRLFDSFDDEAWARLGIASDNPVSVRALGYIIAGHVAHHLNILRERYA